jgi:carbonic anhydrase/acetyltransferase-like protein (isoleucine patch superfamily)
MGAPGKVVREIGADQARMLAAGSMHYVQNWKRYRAELKEV